MVYEFQGLGYSSACEDIFRVLPDRSIGLLLWVLTSLALILYCLYRIRSGRERISPALCLLLPSLIFAGMFINLYGVIDEVSINLQHPYNLYHFGHFSMSPDKMVDGTVEVLHTLLHTPFAQSPTTLILGNFLLSLVIGWLHLFILWRAPFADGTLAHLLLLACFASWLPLVSVFASGFGNGLVSLLFLMAIRHALQKRYIPSLVLSGLLPLVRPDALFLSAINALIVFKSFRREQDPPFSPWRASVPLLVLPLLSTSVYLFFFKIAYDHWIPTPILFKSLTPTMLAMFNWRDFAWLLTQWLSSPLHCFALVVFFLSILVFFNPRPSASLERDLILLIRYTGLTSVAFIFFNFSRATTGDFGGPLVFSRYWVSFEVTLAFMLLLSIARLRIMLPPSPTVLLGSCGPALFLFCLTVSAALPKGIELRRSDSFTNRTDVAIAGCVTRRIIPDSMSVSTSEMNTFGLTLGRPILDLWGYSEPEIAESPVCNGDKIRSNETLFLSRRPDVYWAYWFSSDPTRFKYDRLEESLDFHHLNKRGNLLGDMNRVLDNYDVFLVRPDKAQVAYLVRKDKRDILLAHLSRDGYRLARSRDLDTNLFRSFYDRQEKMQYDCS